MVDKIKKYIRKQKKKDNFINKMIKEEKEKFSNFSLTGKVLYSITFLVLLEIFLVSMVSITNNIILDKPKVENKANILNYIKDNKKKIEKIDLIMSGEYINYIVKLKEAKITDEKPKIQKTHAISFFRNYEEKFLNENINYELKENKKFDNFFILSMLYAHFGQFLMVLLFLYIFEKQGLFGDAGKYKKISPDTIKGDFNDLIGMEEIKEEIFQLEDMLKNRHKYKEFAIDNSFNILMSGPPGTGKTKMASYLAKELDVPFIIGTGNIETGYVAGGSTILKSLFQKARMEAKAHPSNTCIIFLDEAQTLLRKRGNMSMNKYEDDSANELLSQLDGINTEDSANIIFIAASNFDNNNMELDEAMLRRFKKKIYFRLPNRIERKKIFEHYIHKIDTRNLGEIDFEHLGEISANCSPAIIETIVQESGLMAINTNSLIDTILLDKAFERIIIGKTTYNKDKEAIMDIIAYHEIGHFIQEYITAKDKASKKAFQLSSDVDNIIISSVDIKKHINVLKISVESIEQYNTLGYVLNKEEDLKLKTKKDLENEIVALYGGIAAEKVFFSENDNDDNITIGSANDIEKVSKIFNTMINNLGMYSVNKKINLSLIDNVDFKENNAKILEKEADRLYNTAIDNIESNKKLIIFLAEKLIQHQVLNISEVFDAIEEFNKPVIS